MAVAAPPIDGKPETAFAKAYDWIGRLTLSPSQKLVYIQVVRFPKGENRLTNEKIAENVGLSARQVKRILSDLDSKGFLYRTYQHPTIDGKTTTLRQLHPLKFPGAPKNGRPKKRTTKPTTPADNGDPKPIKDALGKGLMDHIPGPDPAKTGDQHVLGGGTPRLPGGGHHGSNGVPTCPPKESERNYKERERKADDSPKPPQEQPSPSATSKPKAPTRNYGSISEVIMNHNDKPQTPVKEQVDRLFSTPMPDGRQPTEPKTLPTTQPTQQPDDQQQTETPEHDKRRTQTLKELEDIAKKLLSP